MKVITLLLKNKLACAMGVEKDTPGNTINPNAIKKLMVPRLGCLL